MKRIFILIFILIHTVCFASQGMGPGPGVRSYAASNPTPFFASDWEGSGILDSSKWSGENGSGELAVATDHAFTGTHSLKFDSASTVHDYIEYTGSFSGHGGDVGVRFALRIHSFFEYYNSFVMYTRFWNSASYGQLLEFGADCNYAGNCDSTALPTYLYLWSDGSPNMVVGAITSTTLDVWVQVEIRNIKNVSQSWKLWDAAGTTLLYSATNTTGVPNYDIDHLIVGVVEDPGGLNTFWIDDYVMCDADWCGPRTGTSPF